MQNILKVTPEKLIETADHFTAAEQNVRVITNEMKAIVEGFKSIWQGGAATGFINRFNGLSDDMEKMCSMIREHSSDLIEMAGQYKTAEEESLQEAGSLNTEAIS